MRWLALALVAAAPVGAGCGAQADPDDVAAAVGATQARGSARVEMVMRSTYGSEQSEFRTTGVVDYADDRRDVTTRYPAAGNGPSQSVRAITIGNVEWVELAGFEALAPAGKRWLRSDSATDEAFVEKHSEPRKTEDGWSRSFVIYASPTGAEASPDDFLEYLWGVADDPERLGEERVRGVETTRYRTTLDVRRAMRRDLENEGWAERNIERALEGMQDDPVEIDIWIGVDGLVRRIVSRDDEAFGGETWSTETTTEFFDFGVETDIRPPPPGEVMEQEEWLRLVEAEQDRGLEENQNVDEVP